MDAFNKNGLLLEKVEAVYTPPRENKFTLMNCSISGIHCKDSVLPEINRLYAEAEIYRINKEYQRSIELLQQAYQKTFELKESPCTRCVAFFQYNIKETLETMQDELYSMSNGIFSRGRYENILDRLGNVIGKMNPFKTEQSLQLSLRKFLGMF
ncbi:MAG: hypothetical protein R2757_20870 [Draconibacterium sp.]